MAKQSAYFHLRDAIDKHGMKEVKAVLGGLPGVFSVAVGEGGSAVSVDYDSTGVDAERLEKTLQKLCDGAHLEAVEGRRM